MLLLSGGGLYNIQDATRMFYGDPVHTQTIGPQEMEMTVQVFTMGVRYSPHWFDIRDYDTLEQALQEIKRLDQLLGSPDVWAAAQRAAASAEPM